MSGAKLQSGARPLLGAISSGTGDCVRIAEGSPDLPLRDVLAEFLWADGYDIDVRPESLIEEGIDLLQSGWLRSIVKSDLDLVFDAELGDFHTDGSGNRTKHFWWVDQRWFAYEEKIDADD